MFLILLAPAQHDCFSNGYRHDRVICIIASMRKKRKLLGLNIIKFVF